ncbi:MAG TPA: Hsp20/alpha crystallin family protein [Anditalea sp.]|nr:Hsp20/alpha crystallin family protein [Anditalea sp.]
MNSLTKRNGGIPSLFLDFFNNNPLFKRDIFDFEMDMPTSRLGVNVPMANLTENQKEFLVELAAPGLDRNDFTIELDDQTLSISAEKEMEEKKEEGQHSRKEYSFHSFKRTFYIPQPIKENLIEAKYDKGILKVVMPKQKEAQTKNAHRIEIK